jgi:lipid II:glycine glycyltransferase (peptidoglycan interpeptide bridge formation enzyme)
MLSITRKLHTLTYREIYFPDGELTDSQREDVRYILQSRVAEPGSAPFCTSVIDLKQDEQDIFNAVKKSFSYDIRRARDKDNIRVTSFFSPDADTLKSFIEFYNEFATSKRLAVANAAKLEKLAAAGGLVITFACEESSATELRLCAHAYICDGTRARLLYSAGNVQVTESAGRQLIGRANKLMHWKMITTFRDEGFLEYDLGGLGETSDVKSIADFKRAFGGKDVVEYNALHGVSLKGKSAVFLFRLRQRFKGRAIV